MLIVKIAIGIIVAIILLSQLFQVKLTVQPGSPSGSGTQTIVRATL